MSGFGFPRLMPRRHFLKHMAGFSLMAGAGMRFVQNLAAAAPKMKKENKSLIILWLSGGPSHMDLWDLKPGEPNGGEFKPIKTAVTGIEICEHLPKVAEQMSHLSIIRSMVTNEGSHERGRVLMHTAYQPNPSVTYPSIGAVASQQIGDKKLSLPGFISIGGPSEGPGFLGMTYAPFTVQNPGSPPQNISTPGELGEEGSVAQVLRRRNRREMLALVEDRFIRERRGEEAKAHKDIYRKAFDLTDSQIKAVFDLKYDGIPKPGKMPKAMDAKLTDEYGKNAFGRGCLLARKLVEAGVTCVEVDIGGWDNHNMIFPALHNSMDGDRAGLADRLDRGMGTLVKDLVKRDMWKNTVLLCLGEFGRTPRINQNAGRDHWASCWSVVVGGGGLKGGLVHGSTEKDGGAVKDNPATVGDLFATLYNALGISPALEIRDPLGRPRKITGEKAAAPIKALL